MRGMMFFVLLLATGCLLLSSGITFTTEITLPILLLAVSLDFYTTWKCLKLGGKEGNPIIAWLFRRVGVNKSFVIVAMVWVCFIAFRWIHAADNFQTASAFTYWLVPWNNSMVLKRLRLAKVKE